MKVPRNRTFLAAFVPTSSFAGNLADFGHKSFVGMIGILLGF